MQRRAAELLAAERAPERDLPVIMGCGHDRYHPSSPANPPEELTMRNLPILLLTLAVATTAAACDGGGDGDRGDGDRGATSEAIGGSSTQPGGAQSNPATYPSSTTFGSACQAAADAVAACGATYAATLDTAAEETTGDEVAAAECVDDASTDDWYNCMADAYDAGDCGTMDGMLAAATAAAACAASM